jgi:AbiEi antitoxin C-terminal domain
VPALEQQIEERLVRGQRVFSAQEILGGSHQSPEAFEAAARRLKRKHRLANPWRGFFLILSPEDQATGAPDPIRWIDPLMAHIGVDYRVSLLSAAAVHGSSHQAAMVFQVIAPKQLRSFEIGRHRIQFVYQSPESFAEVNQPQYLAQIKSPSGFAKAAGVELLLLDSIRYFHRASGMDGVAQIVRDLGRKADPRKLAKLAAAYENSSVRRLGFLLEQFGMNRQAEALVRFAKKAKSMKLLDSSIRPLPGLLQEHEACEKWMLTLNRKVEIDS